MDTKFKEIELKYSASNISLQRFLTFCQERDPIKYLTGFGPDYFYSNSKDETYFQRYRVASEYKELTLKRKLNSENNVIRTERNMKMHKSMTKDKIDGYMKEIGYEYNTMLYKVCHVFEYSYYSLVYYICFDAGMSEMARFIEIEMKEEYPWESINHAISELNAMEIICKPLGLKKKDRINESLFELFRIPAKLKKEECL